MDLALDWPWLVFILIGIVLFVLLEGRAFRHPERQHTLSRFVSTLGAKFPLSIAIFGMIIGGLLVHFFWGWSSNPIITGG